MHVNPAGRPDALDKRWEIGHGNRRNPSGFDFTGNQTPGLVADWSDGNHKSKRYPVFLHRRCNPWGCLSGHQIRSAPRSDKAKNSKGNLSNSPFPYKRPEMVEWKSHIDIRLDQIMRNVRMPSSEALAGHIARQFDNPRITFPIRGICEWRVHISSVQSGRADYAQTDIRQRDPNRTPRGLIEAKERVSLESDPILMGLD
jgi:hypothetical protein